MDKKKAIKKVIKILSKYNLYKVNAYLSLLSYDDAYRWILRLLRFNKNYDLKPVELDSLIENYLKEINILESELQEVREERISPNKIQGIKGGNSQYEHINNDLIHLGIEDLYLRPLLRNFRNEDKIRETLLLLENKPETHSQRIAQLKSLKRYYQNRKKEFEAISEFSTLPEKVISEIISKIYALVPDWKSKIGKQKTRGYEKGTPTKKQTHLEIQKCLNHKKFYHENGDPNVYKISHQVHRRLNSKFEKGELPGVAKMVEVETIKKRVEKYLNTFYHKR